MLFPNILALFLLMWMISPRANYLALVWMQRYNFLKRMDSM